MTGLIFVPEDSGFFRQSQIGLGQLIEGGLQRFGSCHHHDIPTREEFFLIEPVNFPQATANPVADVGLAQLFAHRNAHPVAARPILSGIEHQIGAGLAVGVIKPPENVIEF